MSDLKSRKKAIAKRPRLNDSGRSVLAIPRVKQFLELMVEGTPLKDAAKAVGLRMNRARLLIRDPAVRRAFYAMCEDLQASQRPLNILAAMKIRDGAFDDEATAATKKVALDAARYLDGDTGSGSGGTTVHVNVTPGYVIDLSGHAEGARVIEHQRPALPNRLTDHEDVGE